MDILLISSIFAGLGWLCAIFLLFSVIQTHRIEKVIRKHFLKIGKSVDLELENIFSDIKENYQNLFYWSAGLGVLFYLLPQAF